MNKDHGRLVRRPTGKRLAAASVRRPKRVRSRIGSIADKETATGRRLAPLTANRRGGLVQDLNPLASGLGRVAAQALRHMRIGKLGAALADAHKLVANILCRQCSLE